MAIIVQAVRKRRGQPGGWNRGRVAVVPACIVVLGLLVLVAGTARAQAPETLVPEGTFVRVTVDGGVSPFTSVQYDVTARGRTVVVSQVKETLCYRGQQERVRLVDGDEARRLVAALDAVGAWRPRAPEAATPGTARDRPAPRSAPRYEFWSAFGSEMTRFSVGEAALRECPDLMRVWVAVREAVDARTGAIPMRDLYHPARRLGFLTITATEAATATMDGWDTFPLPVDSLEVVEGDHRVRVVGESGTAREFRVRVVAGGANRVHVLLDEQE